MNNIEMIKNLAARNKVINSADVLYLIAQLEAAQKEVHGLKMKLSDAGCLLVERKQRVEKAEKERDDLLNQEFQQRLANAEHQLYMKDLAIHNIKASRVAQFKKRLAAEAALSAANEKLSKPVVLPIKYNPAVAGNKSTRANFIWHNDAISYCADAIKAAGFTVEGNADAE
ncbi:hypothetical protein [Yersinia aleksiciae]|uniref:Ead/Ea22-like family protein n=1 Tax=Yersinia aleksiciae TaxID=263819 RepID=A0A0T9V126_YERAE|nr:hypothetical protein [Yersinia aleksiciae]CNL93741.1 Uncharacterised protein [Yersinia aleksiciae]